MKNLLFILMMFSAYVSAQTSSYTIQASRIKSYPVDERTVQITTRYDTMSGETVLDTIVIGGDTITTNYPDTLFIQIPYNIYGYSQLICTTVMERIVNEDTLEGVIRLYTSACLQCPFELTDQASLELDRTTTFDTPLLNIRAYLMIIATDGIGTLRNFITIKRN